MSVLKVIAIGAAKIVSADLADTASSLLDKASDGLNKIEEKKQKKENKKLAAIREEHPNHIRLLLIQERGKFKEFYQVLDLNNQIRYVIKGELLSKKHHLHIYDATGRTEIGMAKEKLIALRGPFSLDSDPKNFELFLNGKSLGKMKTKASFGKTKFYLDFNDWLVSGDFLRNTYQITSGDDLVMTVTDKCGTMVYDPYVLDIMDQKNELLCLLVAVVIDAAKTTKREENEFAKEQLKRSLDPFSSPHR